MEKQLPDTFQNDLNFCYEQVITTENSRVEESMTHTGDINADHPLNATDLFSLFTADIIKEELLFVR